MRRDFVARQPDSEHDTRQTWKRGTKDAKGMKKMALDWCLDERQSKGAS